MKTLDMFTGESTSKTGLFSGFGDSSTLSLGKKCQVPTNEWTKIQIAWVVLQTVVSACICFGANFGIATIAMYWEEPPTLFQFPVPMTGNYAITIIVETIVNWIISASLMSMDVLNGMVPPINPSCIYFWPEPESKYTWWLCTSEMVAPVHAGTTIYTRFKIHMKRCFPWIFIQMVTLFPLCIIISYAVWGNDNYKSFAWQGEFTTAALGSIIAVLTIPFWAIITLGNLGYRHRNQ